jgi:pimeloyl-ACP methyl ester carboxylesterase
MAKKPVKNEDSLRHGYAQVGSVRLHYVEQGKGGQLVLLLHGFPECWYSWRHQLKILGAEFRVVALDMRGYNLSDKPPRIADYALANLVDDVTGLIRQLGHEQAAIVGHDWGAAVAWETALRQPEYVTKIAALQVPPVAAWRDNLTVWQILRSWYMFFFQIPLLPEWLLRRNHFALLTQAIRRMMIRQEALSETDMAFYRNALGEPGALNSALNYYRANVRRLLAAPAEENKVKTPALFIYGEQDPVILPSTIANVERYVDAPYREARLKNCGHFAQQEAKEEVSAELLSFLKE